MISSKCVGLILLIVLPWATSQKVPKVTIFFLDYPYETPIAISEEMFWSSGKRQHMDTLFLHDTNLANAILESIRKFKFPNEDLYVENKVAIIISKGRNKNDTFYTHNFENYRHKNQYYVDTGRSIKRMLSGFLIKE